MLQVLILIHSRDILKSIKVILFEAKLSAAIRSYTQPRRSKPGLITELSS